MSEQNNLSIWEIWIDDLCGELAMDKNDLARRKVEVVEKADFNAQSKLIQEKDQVIADYRIGNDKLHSYADELLLHIKDRDSKLLAAKEEAKKWFDEGFKISAAYEIRGEEIQKLREALFAAQDVIDTSPQDVEMPEEDQELHDHACKRYRTALQALNGGEVGK